MDANYFDTLSNVESGGRNIGAGTSSAFGPYQFTSGTWNALIASHPELGLSSIDRFNPAAQTAAIRAFTQDNASALQKAGQQPTNTNLYMAHLFGAGGGARFIAANQSNPNDPAYQHALPDAVAANKPLFFNADGTPKTVAQVYGNFDAKFNGGTMQVQGPQQGQPKPAALPQVSQQTIGSLQNGAPYLQRLAQALQGESDTLANKARSPWEALGSIAEQASANANAQGAKEADKDYVTKLAAALSGGDRGQLATALLANPDTRAAGFSMLAAPKPQAEIKPIGTDYLGNTQYGKVYPDGRIEKIDPNALNAAGAQPGQANAATPAKTLTPDMKGQDVLDALPPAIASKVKNVISGDDVLNPREKDYTQMSTLAYQTDPTFSRTDANIRYKYKQDFMDPKGKVGTVRVAMNNALGHASDAYDLSQGFPDTGFKLANRVGNWWSDQTNDPTLSKYQTVTTALANEMARISTGGETSDSDRKAWLDKFDPSRGPTALKDAFSEAGSILNSKLQSLKHDWMSNMGPNALPPNVLAQPSVDMMKKLGIGGEQAQPADQTVSKTQPAQPGKVLRYNPQTGGLE